PIINYLDDIKLKIPNFYFHFTLNDYENEKLEPNVPPLNERIDTFKELSEKIGKDKVIWRFDPVILTYNNTIEDLLKRIENIGNQLLGYTNKLVFSFADIKIYKKVQNNLKKNDIPYSEFNERLMHEFSEGLSMLNKSWNYELASCAEKLDFNKYGIIHNKCIDDDLIAKLFYNDKQLMDFLGIEIEQKDLFNTDIKYKKTRVNKDSGQRAACGCIISKDIGQYNTCAHLCEYCYANASKKIALENYNKHIEKPNSETITGE
ncbi:MAG: DUF1848 domain-containing protein, partial [Bacteroidetes bacterium]|nr:DUF1848 domain-containing protein [Bacteroidota bacterium]